MANRILKFSQVLVKITNKIPLFSCKKSKQTYTQRQHVTVLGLMKYLRTDYRRVIETLDLMPEVKQVIGLNRLPHYTTIHKFLQRFTRYRFDRLLDHTVDLFKTGLVTLAIDGTGFSSTCSSEYSRLEPRSLGNSCKA